MPGIGPLGAVELLSEIGRDMGKWSSAKHLAAWANLVPNTKISGGKVISSHMQSKKNHAGQTLRMAASTLTRGDQPINGYARKMRAKLGKKGGVVATAHKLARIVYTMIKEKKEYDPMEFQQQQDKWKNIKIKQLEKQLEALKA